MNLPMLVIVAWQMAAMQLFIVLQALHSGNRTHDGNDRQPEPWTVAANQDVMPFGWPRKVSSQVQQAESGETEQAPCLSVFRDDNRARGDEDGHIVVLATEDASQAANQAVYAKDRKEQD